MEIILAAVGMHGTLNESHTQSEKRRGINIQRNQDNNGYLKKLKIMGRE